MCVCICRSRRRRRLKRVCVLIAFANVQQRHHHQYIMLLRLVFALTLHNPFGSCVSAYMIHTCYISTDTHTHTRIMHYSQPTPTWRCMAKLSSPHQPTYNIHSKTYKRAYIEILARCVRARAHSTATTTTTTTTNARTVGAECANNSRFVSHVFFSLARMQQPPDRTDRREAVAAAIRRRSRAGRFECVLACSGPAEVRASRRLLATRKGFFDTLHTLLHARIASEQKKRKHRANIHGWAL